MTQRHTIGSKHTEVADERFQPTPVTCRADHGVGSKAGTIDEHYIRAVKSLHFGDDARDTALEGGDESVIYSWVAPVIPIAGIRPLRRAWDAKAIQVSESQSLRDGENRIGQLEWHVIRHENQKRLTRNTENLAASQGWVECASKP